MPGKPQGTQTPTPLPCHFDLEPVSTEVAGFGNVLDEFGKSLYTGSVDPDEYLPKLLEKLEATGIDKVIDEMQRQIDEWKETK